MIMADFECLIAMMEQITTKLHTNHEKMAKLDAHHERMMARINSQLEKREACLKNGGNGRNRIQIGALGISEGRGRSGNF
jgi:hypothetical protein